MTSPPDPTPEGKKNTPEKQPRIPGPRPEHKREVPRIEPGRSEPRDDDFSPKDKRKAEPSPAPKQVRREHKPEEPPTLKDPPLATPKKPTRDAVARFLKRHAQVLFGANLIALIAVFATGWQMYFAWDHPFQVQHVKPNLDTVMAVDDLDAINGEEMGATGGPAAMMRNKIVVSFKEGVSTAQIQQVAASLGLTFVTPYDGAPHIVTALIDPNRRTELLTNLNGNPLVSAAEPDFVFWSQKVPNDKGYPMQWNMQMIGMESAWEYTTGSNAVVAVLDTGVMITSGSRSFVVEDLTNTLSLPGYDFAYGDSEPEDYQGHGTHVTGTIAQSTDNGTGVSGIAYGAKIMPVKVLSNSGGGEMAAIISGIRFAADKGANIINMSLGGPVFSQIMDDAVQYAYKKGVTIICAAGNSGRSEVLYPAGCNHVVAVSAVDRNQNLAGYSTYGFHVEIAAPGGVTDVISQGGFRERIDYLKDTLFQGKVTGIIQNTVYVERPNRNQAQLKQGYRSFQGTSMACPHVSGAAALIYSLGTTNPADIRTVIRQTAFKKDPPEKFGAGILDAAAAVRSVAKSKQIITGKTNGLLWAAAAVAAIVLLSGGSAGNLLSYLPEAVGLAGGLFLPDYLTKEFGLTSYANLIAHSVAVPALIVLLVPQFFMLARVCSFMAVGVGITIYLAHQSSTTLLPVLDPQKKDMWLYANLAFAGLVLATYWMNRVKWVATRAPA